jgi:hypothetical protein
MVTLGVYEQQTIELIAYSLEKYAIEAYLPAGGTITSPRGNLTASGVWKS